MGAAEDKLEVLELIAQYCWVVDGTDPVAVADVFTDDGAIHFVYPTSERVVQGREDLIAFAKTIVARRSEFQSRHHIGTTSFQELTPERVLARSYLLLTRSEPGKGYSISTTGIYEDEIVRTPEGWRFKLRRLFFDPRLQPQAQG